jgi:tRNA-specific 2-thiouridylase
MKKKVAVGLSGGIDSSFAAYLLKKQGYDVCGFTLKFYPQDNRCCDLDGLYQAQRLCAKLKIPHYVIDTAEFFKKEIVGYFIKNYLDGFTPNPCSFCNRAVKFGELFEKIRAMGFDYLATGHYSRIVSKNDIFLLKCAVDKNKSQEYFLSLIKPQVLPFLIFPLGSYTKDKVKKISQKEKLMFQERKESQDVCFVKEKQYYNFIEKTIEAPQKYYGEIRHLNGKVLGRHKGLYYFTIGQRAGLGISWNEPLYVLNLDEKTNTVIVGERKYLAKNHFTVASLNYFINPNDLFNQREKNNLCVKIRYNSQFYPCSIAANNAKIKVKLREEATAITPGQIAVFYERDTVSAAGVIDKEF